MVSDTDDLYRDEKTKQIFIGGSGGAINTFKRTGSNTYKLVTEIKTPAGARTSLLVPELQPLLLATRANGSTPAKLLVYKLRL